MKPDVQRNGYHVDLRNCQPSNLALIFLSRQSKKEKTKSVTETAQPIRQKLNRGLEEAQHFLALEFKSNLSYKFSQRTLA